MPALGPLPGPATAALASPTETDSCSTRLLLHGWQYIRQQLAMWYLADQFVDLTRDHIGFHSSQYVGYRPTMLTIHTKHMYEAMHIPSSTDNMAKLPTKTKNVLGAVTNCSSAWITSVSSNETAYIGLKPRRSE